MPDTAVLSDASDKIYEDHFPGYPVVPGSFVLQTVIEILQAERKTISFRNVRFRKFMEPDSYQFLVSKSGEGWKFKVMKNGEKYVTGEVE